MNILVILKFLQDIELLYITRIYILYIYYTFIIIIIIIIINYHKNKAAGLAEHNVHKHTSIKQQQKSQG